MIWANILQQRALAVLAICAFTNSMLTVAQKPENRPVAHTHQDWSLADSPPPIQFAGIPEDWSFHHVIFSNPGTADDAARNGTYAKWSTIVNNPRFGFQQQKRENRREGSGLIHVAPTALSTDWSMDLGSAATVGAGQYPAKYTLSYTTASCTDWVAYNTGAAGVSGGQANIEAFTNVYSGTCPTSPNPVPTVYWAYFSGTGRALTSPVVSYDGTKVAYIENTAAGAILRIIQWKSGQGTAAAAVPPDHLYTNTTAGKGSNTAWSACTSGSCMISVAFQNGKQDTISAPFYEYTSADTLWVGDASGNLHEFTGVFSGTPGEVVTGGWPIAVSGNVLASPVFDSASGNVFVGDSGGILYSYKASTAANQMTSSKLTASGNTTGIVDGPMVDSTTEEVYVPIGNDANTSTSVACENTTGGCSGVFQFSATNTTVATAGTSCVASSNTGWTGTGFNCGVEAIFGVGAYNNMYGGSFDQSYYSAGTGKAGYLWECSPSNAHGTTIAPRLNAVAIQSNGSLTPSGDVISPNGASNNVTTIISSLTSTTSGVACSPVTEFYNAGNSTAITKLGAGITSTTQTSITVNSNTGIVAGDYIQIGSEAMLVTATSGATGLTVDRGQIGTTASTYSSGANVTIPAVDYLYLSVTENGNIAQDLTSCSGACLYNIAVGTAAGSYVAVCNTGVSPHTGNCPIEGVPESSGTSGIIIDNYGTAAGESQIYFTPLASQSCAGNGTSGSSGTGGCAIQTSQIVP